MSEVLRPVISIVVPVYNEERGLSDFHHKLESTCQSLKIPYELIYVDDGSTDKTVSLIEAEAKTNPHIRLVKLTRNFGKESALTAGITEASGQAIITIDGDGQHPIDLLPKFMEIWRSGVPVVIGVRKGGSGGLIKYLSSSLFYRTFNRLTNQKLVPGSTDYRLIDQS